MILVSSFFIPKKWCIFDLIFKLWYYINPSGRIIFMKVIDGPSVKKVFRAFLLVVLSFIMIISCCAYRNYSTFQSIDVVVKKTATV